MVRQIKRKINEGQSLALPYLEQYYNVQGFYPSTADVRTTASSRILNSTIEALNEDERLPRMLIIILDKDILGDFKKLDYGIAANITLVLNSLTREIDIAVRRKYHQILKRKPGALGADTDPAIIYVDFIQRSRRFERDSKINKICNLRFKFNKILHEAADEQGHKVLSIRECSGHHFDDLGNLTNTGKIAFWKEMDFLLEEFDNDKIKLLPKLHKISSTNEDRGSAQRQHHYNEQPKETQSSKHENTQKYDRYFTSSYEKNRHYSSNY